MIHKEALAAEHLSEELHDILETVISAINFIKNTPKAKFIKAMFFEKMCKVVNTRWFYSIVVPAGWQLPV